MTAHHTGDAPTASIGLDVAVFDILSRSAGPVSALLRTHLVELMGALTRSLYGNGAEPPDADGEQLLTAVHACLRMRPEPGDDQQPPRPDPPETVRRVVEALLADNTVARHLGEPPSDGRPAHLWEWLHLGLRAAPVEAAARGRGFALDAFLVADDQQAVPACQPVGHPGWSGAQEYLGILASQLPEPVFQQLMPLMSPLAEVLAMVDRATGLHTGHSMYPTPRLTSLAMPDEREQFVRLAVDYVRSLPDDGRLVSDIARLVPCDEFVRSVVPIPLPSSRSWWANVAERSAAALGTFAQDWGAKVRLPESGCLVDDPRVKDFLDPDSSYVRIRVTTAKDRMLIRLLRASWQQDDRWGAARVLVGEAV